jgi:hypothetical protein
MEPAKVSPGFFIGLTANYDLLYKSIQWRQHDLYNISMDFRKWLKRNRAVAHATVPDGQRPTRKASPLL